MISLRQALVMELRLNRGRFGASVLLCALCLILAFTFTDALMVVLPLWAALAWYRYGRADTIEREELRASLGLSRADRVRGRTALISVETMLLILTTAVWLLLAQALTIVTSIGPGPTFTISGPPGLREIVLVVAGSLQSAVVLLLTAIGVGRESVTRRPGLAMAMLSLAVYFGAGLLSSIVVGIPMAALAQTGAVLMPYLVTIVILLVIGSVLGLLLRGRVRAWIRRLDSGPARSAVRETMSP